MRAIDLFCGCGGLSLGFQNAGIQIVRAYDNWDKAVNIYNANFVNHKAELKNAYDITVDELKAYNPDLIIGDHLAKIIHQQGNKTKLKVEPI